MSDPSLTLKTHGRAREIPEARWNALLTDDDTPFQRWVWFDAMEANGCATGRRGWQPMHLGLYRGDALVALAPAYARGDSQGEFVFDHGWARAAMQAGIDYYPKLTLAVPFTPVTGRRVLTAPGEDRPSLVRALFAALPDLIKSLGLSSAHALFPTDEEATLAAEAGAAIRYGAQYHWFKGDCQTWGDYLARFDSKRRNQIKRETRAPAEQGVTITTRRGSELSVDDAPMVHRLYRSTVDRFLWGRPYLNEKFFADVLRRYPEALELVEARDGDRVIAGAFNVGDGRRLFGRYWGCFEERPFLHFNVCYYHSIAECLARGVERFEGGAGGEHKISRGFEPARTVSAHYIADPRLDRAVRDSLRRERAAVELEIEEIRRTMGFRPVLTARGME
ncbi:MAG: GNAT family N-acetyltransferase [Polyangiales bacterium]